MKTYTEPMLGQASAAGRQSRAEATVLVIDDDPSMHDILAVLGSQHGFGIQFAEDGRDGVRLAEQNDVDLIVLDLNLPGLTGFDVCRRIRSAGIEIPIVMVSASSDPVDVVVGLEIGADDYVTKPFGIRELLARIRARLRRHVPAPAAGLKSTTAPSGSCSPTTCTCSR